MFWEWITYVLGKLMFFTGAVRNGTSFPKPLSADEEKECLRLIKEGDEEAKEKLIKHNLRLVAHIVKKYSGVAETDDLLSVGSIGLIKAVNTFEQSKGTQLATYTARCIENEILMLLRSNKKHRNNVSLEGSAGLDKDGNELALIDLLCEKEDTVFQQVDRSIGLEKFIEKIKGILTEREFRVINLRFGLYGGKNYAQREVAALLKISRSYISRIEKRAIEKLREHIKKEDFCC